MLAPKLLCLVVFLASWLHFRRSNKASLTDVFVIAFIVIIAPPFLFNPSGTISLYNQSFTNDVVSRAEIGVMCALLAGAAVFCLRWVSGQRLVPERMELADRDIKIMVWSALAIALMTFVALMSFGEFRSFRLATTRFLLGDLSGPEYRFVRGQVYSNSLLLDGIVGRLRYALLPLLYVVPLIALFQRRQWLFATLFSVVFLLALPMSLSKLPIVFFMGYFATTLVACWGGVSLRNLIMAACVAVLSLVAMLSTLYLFQYWGAVQEGSFNPVHTALERIWGEPYSVILRHFKVYPDMAPFTGVSGINLLAKIAGIEPRLPELEVAQLALGPDAGSNPGIFFLAGYAGFGFPGLIMFSVFGFLTLWALDEIGNRIRTEFCYHIYMGTMSINCLFLLQVALQTSLLTYGVALIPMAVLVLDRALAWYSRR